MSILLLLFFFCHAPPTTEIYTLSLHDALPISSRSATRPPSSGPTDRRGSTASSRWPTSRSEEHTSELQSRQYLVCRLLLEKKKKKHTCTAGHTVRDVVGLQLRRVVYFGDQQER